MSGIDLNHLFRLHMKFRKVCGGAISKKLNPTENACTKREDGMCWMPCPVFIVDEKRNEEIRKANCQ